MAYVKSAYSLVRAFALKRQGDYARSLAVLRHGAVQHPRLQFDLLHALGMHRSAYQLATRVPALEEARRVQAAVSALQAGATDEARQLCKRACVAATSDRERATLARAFARVDPEFALELLCRSAPSALHAALHWKTGRHEAARQVLARVQPRREPDALLLQANLAGGELTLINRFLAHFRLQPVTRNHHARPLTVNNVGAVHPLPAVSGPLVSVVMAAHNAAETIQSAIASVLNQSYANLELIVVDDGSTDATLRLAEQQAAGDRRLRLVQLGRNRGPSVSRNIGYFRANGELFTCHDADDWSHPQKLERQVRHLLAEPRLKGVTSRLVRLDFNGHFQDRFVYPLTRLNRSSLLFRRQVFDECGQLEEGYLGADAEYAGRIVAAYGSRSIQTLRQPLTFAALRPGSLTMHTRLEARAAARLDYWERWNERLIAALSTQLAYPSLYPSVLEPAPESTRSGAGPLV